MKHRPYQVEALTAIKERREQGVQEQLIQLFTGAGKTVIFASLRSFLALPGKILFLVHTEELADQARDRIREWNPGVSVGVEMAGRSCSPDDSLVVASVATLGRAGSNRLDNFAPAEFDVLVVDEAHHTVAESYRRILRHFGFDRYARPDGQAGDGRPSHSRLLLGVTATTERGDGEGLEGVFEDIVYRFPMVKAIREGWMVNFKTFRVHTEVQLDNVPTKGNQFQRKALSLAVNTPNRNAEIVAKWLEVGESRKTIGFTVNVEHAQCLAQAFRDAGVSAEAVWGEDPERKRKLRDHAAGMFLVLLNCGVLIEGYDDKTVGCVLLGAPTTSPGRLEQMIGRGGRLPPGINNLIEARAAGVAISKEDCILIDVTDNTQRHRLASVASLVGLPPRLNMQGKLLTEVVDEVEALRDSSPETDFDGLEDLENIKSYIESVDLFKCEFAPEVLEFSELQWHKTPRGNYLLLLPGSERITIVKNLVNTWTISGTVRGSTFMDSASDVPHALACGDHMLKLLGRIFIPSVRRENPSKAGKEAASADQVVAITGKLRRLGKGLPDFTKLTKHEAAKMLTALCLQRAA